MTLGTVSRVTYPGTGSVGPFSIPFKFFVASDLEVVIRDASGVEFTLAPSVDFSVTGARDSSGTLTLTGVLTVGDTLSIRRDPTPTQPSTFRNQTSYFGSSHEDALDRVTMLVQALKDQADRSVRLPVSYDPATHELQVAPESGKVLGWDGLALTNKSVDSGAVALPGLGRATDTLSELLANNIPFNVLDFDGVVGDGSHDDTVGLLYAAAQAKLYTKTLLMPPGYVFKTSGTLMLEVPLEATGATILYYGAGVALQLGNGTDILADKTFRCPIIQQGAKTAFGWGTQNGFNIGTSIGLKTVNLYQSQVYVPYVRNFGVGLLEYGSTADGSTYCTFYLGILLDNKINHKVSAEPTVGFCNQNIHIGGRLAFSSGEGTNVAGVRHILVDNVASVINQHVWWMTSVEGNVPEFTIECYGGDNYFRDLRYETQAGPAKVQMNGANAVRNEFSGGVDLRRVAWTFVNGASAPLLRVDNADGIHWAPSAPAGVIVLGNFSSSANPLLKFLKAGKNPHNRDGSDIDWTALFTALQIIGKDEADDPATTQRIVIDFATGNVTTLGAYIGSAYKVKGTVGTPGSATFVDVFDASAAGRYDFLVCIAASGNPAYTTTGKIVADGGSVYLHGTPDTGANITIQIAAGKLQLKRNDGIATTFNYTVKYAPL